VNRQGYTLIELLAAIFVMAVTMVTWGSVARTYGAGWGIGAALSAGSLSVATVIVFYRWMEQRNQRALQNVRDRYRNVYRVIALPADPRIIVMPEGAEIRVGDYGWEAGPSRNDGLIYLQGLTRDWTVVWHAGLRSDEIEKAGEKPNSQYDSWYPYWANPPALPPCPFPVVERETLTVGRPHPSHRYFVQPTAYSPQQTAVADPEDEES